MLVVLDQDTGAVDRVLGPLSVGIGGLAAHPTTRVLFGVTAPGGAGPRNLVRIDPSTAAITIVGPVKPSLERLDAIAFYCPVFIPTLSAWSMLVPIALLVGFGCWPLARRRHVTLA